MMSDGKMEKDDETKALEILLRFLSKKPPHFPSVAVAVHSLDASRRFKVANFAVHALKYIEQFLTTESVLLVFVKLIRFSTMPV